MAFRLEAACGCNVGKLRSNNEDNFWFNGTCLDQDNNGLPEIIHTALSLRGIYPLAVFDGMGGENYGEIAAGAAARGMEQTAVRLTDLLAPEKYIRRQTMHLNDLVVDAARRMHTDRMGTTEAALYFTARRVWICNVGDSRVYRLRDGTMRQLSQDHVESRSMGGRRKAPLTQHLGIDPEEMRIEPYIARDSLRRGDRYLICSDGVTDMLTDDQIAEILTREEDVRSCVQTMIAQALEQGGRDNITAIVCGVC